MSVTYTNEPSHNTAGEDAFVPSYARGARRKKPVRTWMILAPIGALALIGGGAVMMSGQPEAAPLVESPALLAPAPLAASATPLESSEPTSGLMSAPRITVEAPPAPPPAIQRRVARVERAAPAVAAREETAATPTGPQPYSPSTVESAAPTPSAPAISVSPLA